MSINSNYLKLIKVAFTHFFGGFIFETAREAGDKTRMVNRDE